ncbi:MAG: metallO-beta-lactamase superfamily [Bacteroidetes bacterium]|nr:MAG: metallO-beta-lactamase superfamily [Bacteroidota bacterium]
MEITPTLFPVDLQLCSLASGSSGNCYYVGSSSEGVLVDCGISARRIRKMLEELGPGLPGIKAILITHNHIDHISALTRLTKKHRIPVYCTEGTWKGIMRNRMTFDADPLMYHPLKYFEPLQIGALRIEAFPVSHDAHEATGYHFRASGRNLTIATDLGVIGDHAAHYLKNSDVMVIESNYDEEMLFTGHYPEHLKQRVHGSMGHMCNAHTAEFLADNYHSGISHILLCHLSAENNTPEIALQTFHNTFKNKGIQLHANTVVKALPRGNRSEVFILSGEQS